MLISLASILTANAFKKILSSIYLNFTICGIAMAVCSNSSTDQNISTLPLAYLNGKIIFHTYTSYINAATTGNSHLFLFDLGQCSLKGSSLSCQKARQIDQPNWNIVAPMNANFSPDGKSIVFTAEHAVPNGNGNYYWNIYSYQLGTSALPQPIVNNLNGKDRNEDPKFSMDGTEIIFSHNYQIASVPWQPTTSQTIFIETVKGLSVSKQLSMPYLSPNNTQFAFAATIPNEPISPRVMYTDGNSGKTAQLDSGYSYYPIARSNGSLIYINWPLYTTKPKQARKKVA